MRPVGISPRSARLGMLSGRFPGVLASENERKRREQARTEKSFAAITLVSARSRSLLFRGKSDRLSQSSCRSGSVDKLGKCLHDADRVRSLGNQDGEGALNPKFRAMDLDQLSRS